MRKQGQGVETWLIVGDALVATLLCAIRCGCYLPAGINVGPFSLVNHLGREQGAFMLGVAWLSPRECLGCSDPKSLGGLTTSEGGLEEVEESLRALANCSCHCSTCS